MTKNDQLILIFLLSLCSSFAQGQSRKTEISPTIKRQIRSDSISYQKCRKRVMAKLNKNKKPAPESLAKRQEELNSCKNQFPNAALFADCKSQVLKKNKKKPKKARLQLAQCRRLQESASYQPENPVNFFRAMGRSFFAGIDLGAQIAIGETEKLPGFNCDRIRKVFAHEDPEDFLLFGNGFKAIPALARLKPAQLKQALKSAKRTKGEDPYYDVPELGRIYDIAKGKPVVFFPASSCYFDRELGALFNDHKLYFHIDQRDKQLSPYFGASFFSPTQTTATMAEVSKLLKSRLGKGTRVFPLPKKNTLFFGKAKPKEFDLEGDPKNICLTLPTQNFVALLRQDVKRPQYPASLIVANAENACKFGDKLAQRLVLQ